jgi:DNA-binding XRE family transcriptional regulator
MNNIVKFLRKGIDYDLTQEGLADAIGVSRDVIARIEKDGNTSGEVVLKLSRFFKKDAREIFFIDSVVCVEQTIGGTLNE